MISDFYPGILVSWQLDGVKFALGPTIVTTRKHLASFGGYPKLENRPADDLLVGRFIAEQGYEIKLLPYVIDTVADFQSASGLFHKRLRWMTVMRHATDGAFGAGVYARPGVNPIVAVAMHPTIAVAASYFGAYAGFAAR